MKVQRRLIGVDIFRGLAIFAVITLHIDQAVDTIPPTWLKISNFASFCVPFFLAAAFYLAINKIYISQKSYLLPSRLTRLLIPYVAWSIFYLVYKSAKYTVFGQFDKLLVVLQDPLSLLFLGGASYHLYFIPLLATGTLLVKLVEPLARRNFSLKGLGIIASISLLVYEILLVTGNSLKAENIAFEPLLTTLFPEGNYNSLLRLLLVGLFWTLRCLPYVMTAMFLAHPTADKFCSRFIYKYPLFWMLMFLLFNTFGFLVLPQAVEELTRGYTALIAAIALSSSLKKSPLIESIGSCSFGIYFIHILFVEIFQSTWVRLNPNYVNDASAILLISASLVVFLASWGTTILLLKNKRMSQFL